MMENNQRSMDKVEEYNIIECIVESELFEIPRKMELIKSFVTNRSNKK